MIHRQSLQLYEVPFRNLSSATMPPFGVGLITGSNVDDAGLFIPSVNDSASGAVVGLLVNGPREVRSGEFGAGNWGVGPLLALYDYSDGAPALGDTWGPQSGSSSPFKLRKGRMGFTVVSDVTAGSGDDARMFVMPAWQEQPAIVGYLRGSNLQITNADSATRVIPFDAKGYNLGEWPSATLPNALDLQTGAAAKMVVGRSGYWQIEASWSSESSPRFSAPFQSKVQRVQVAVYVNGARTQISGGLADYYHHSLANADTSPTAGVAIRVPGALSTGTYLAAGDELDLRVTVSEVTADSGTATEGYVNFPQIDFLARYVGPQGWRSDF